MGKFQVPLVEKRSLPKAINEFLSQHPQLNKCLTNRDAACSLNTTATKLLYEFLKKHDLEPRVYVGKGFKRSLVNVGRRLANHIAETGEVDVRNKISHGVVKVNDLAIDITHLRLGDEYEPFTFPFRNFFSYWNSISDVTAAVNLKLTDVIELMKKHKEEADLNFQVTAAEQTEYTWFKYVADRKTTIKTRAEKSIVFTPNAIFGVKEFNKTHDKVVFAETPKQVHFVLIPVSDKVMAKSKKYRGKIPAVLPVKVKTDTHVKKSLPVEPASPVKIKPVKKVINIHTPYLTKISVPIAEDSEDLPEHDAPHKRIPVLDEDDDDFEDLHHLVGTPHNVLE